MNPIRCVFWAAAFALGVQVPAVHAAAAKSDVARRIESRIQSGQNVFFVAPLEGAVYPARFSPPTFSWEVFADALGKERGAGLGSWRLTISEEGKVLHEESISGPPRWTPPRKLWEIWTGKKLEAEVGNEVNRAIPVHFGIDHQPLPDDALFRYIGLAEGAARPYQPPQSLVWMDPVASKCEDVIRMGSRWPFRCAGCHATHSPSGLWSFVDYRFDRKRSYRRSVEIAGADDSGRPVTRILDPAGELGGLRYSFSGEKSALFMYRPRGTAPEPYPKAYTFIKPRGYKLHAEAFNKRYVSPFWDIVIADRATGELVPLKGAADAAAVETFPSWSADDKRVAFVRNEGMGKMDIYTVEYNGGKGGQAQPLAGASGNGSDNYFPEFSPDGRWLAFTRGNASGGPFARDSSDIYIVPAAGGRARRLESNVEGVMDSWHSWSSDSRWLLYSSKRDGLATRAYITRIDERGGASAPVELGCEQGVNARVNMPQWIKKGRPPAFSDDELDELQRRNP
ncbi:MAG: hypothetical protein ABIJ96_16465 [Elusimicrobiota bacterium]